jgi:hypothetical protein
MELDPVWLSNIMVMVMLVMDDQQTLDLFQVKEVSQRRELTQLTLVSWKQHIPAELACEANSAANKAAASSARGINAL